MENFWSTLKIELVYRTSWRTRGEAENAIFEYIDPHQYNTRRIQRELGYRSPDEYETTWHTDTEPDNLTPAPRMRSSRTQSRRLFSAPPRRARVR
jgi:putative transposase